MNKIINCKCVCDKVIIWNNEPIVILDTCEHILHRSCLTKKNCPLCKQDYNRYYTHNLLLKENKPENYQKLVDLTCITNTSHIYPINKIKITNKIPQIIDFLGKLSVSHGIEDSKKLVEQLFHILNTKIIIYGSENISKQKKIIIANHSSILDHGAVLYAFNCGFLSSSHVAKSTLGKKFLKLMPMLLIDRTKKDNTVEKIKDYVQNTGDLCLYPEGFISHPDTIAQFRTGAFYAQQNIQPVVIKYDYPAYDGDTYKNLMRILSLDSLTIKLYILPLETPPFDNNKIESIRNKMAKVGNFAMSRVSNRDINENTR